MCDGKGTSGHILQLLVNMNLGEMSLAQQRGLSDITLYLFTPTSLETSRFQVTIKMMEKKKKTE